jgi:hypothetical protein
MCVQEQRTSVTLDSRVATAFVRAWAQVLPLDLVVTTRPRSVSLATAATLLPPHAADVVWTVDAALLLPPPNRSHLAQLPGQLQIRFDPLCTDSELAAMCAVAAGNHTPPFTRARAQFCVHLTDPTPLAHLHTVDLSLCPHISNVEALTGVKTLNLSSTDVCDVRALASVDTLVLTNCHSLRDVSALGHVRCLYMKGCTGIELGFEQLGQPPQHLLDLSHTPIAHVAHLGRVHALDIAYCPNVASLQGLDTCHFVEVAKSRTITSFAGLEGCHHVRATMMISVFTCRGLENCDTVELDSCFNIRDVQALGHVRVVHLSNCPQVLAAALSSDIYFLLFLFIYISFAADPLR